MTARRLDAAQVGLPRFDEGAAATGDVTLFDLSSHQRARDALRLGLSVDDLGFNIFVVGEDRSGRMTATLAYLHDYTRNRPVASDWVYLNNFQRPHKPRPYRLTAGTGRKLRGRLGALIPALREALKKAFESPDFGSDMQRLSDEIGAEVETALEGLKAEGRERGLYIDRAEQGLAVAPLGPDGNPVDPQTLDDEQRRQANEALESLRESIRAFNLTAARASGALGEKLQELRRRTADGAIAPLLDDLEHEFGAAAGLRRWLVELRADILEHLALFLPQQEAPPHGRRAEDRYAVNLFVDHTDSDRSPIVLEPNPTYENLFGYIEYRAVNGVFETDFAHIRPGSLHRANGGILVLRADALARDPFAWEALKGALRDRELRIEERHRRGAVPLAGAPSPKPIPLDVKVVVVGAPRWYYAFFSLDPDFRIYFKVKADIDPDLPITPGDLATYRALVQRAATQKTKRECAADAVEYMLGYATRWAGRRDRLTARFELLEDVLDEAGALANADGSGCLMRGHVRQAIEDRRRRNARIEERAQEQIADGTVMIDVAGRIVGQINGLTVQSSGDHSFGLPARVTARTFAGPNGVLNIERVIALGGPIQQKGVYVLEGFLAGRFAQRFPLAFTASITFEQSYGGVEGDSASLAELIAILSSLSGVPVRQDIAITGSVNQHGESQAIGGANEKIEGFFRACQLRGLSGEQGVVIPAANERHLTLSEPVTEAIAAGRFAVWSVETVEEAIEILTGVPAGEPDADGNHPADSVYGRVLARLEEYDRALTARGGLRALPA